MTLCGQFHAQEATIKLSGSIFGSDSDMLFISQMYDDNKIKDFDTILMDKEGKFEKSIILPREDYYLLRLAEFKIHLVCRNNADIKIYGDGKKLNNYCNILNSDESVAMNSFSKTLEDFQYKNDSAVKAIK